MRERILYVTDGFAPFVIGGMQSVARRQMEALHMAGYEVVSVSSRSKSEPHDIPWRNHHIAWPQRSIRQRVSPFRYIDDLRSFSEFVCNLAGELEPDFVYSEGPLLDSYLRLPRNQRAVTLFHPHGLEMFQDKGSLIEDLKSAPLRSITAFHARQADYTLCLSDGGRLFEILTNTLRVPEERIRVVKNAAPPVTDFDALTLEQSPSSGFLFVGRDEPRKGVRLLVDAATGLDDVKFNLVGISKMKGKTPKNINFLGEIRDREKLEAFYRKAQFLIVPSFAEGLPTVILEAFSCGTPVIATDVGATSDLVKDAQTGFLIPPNDPSALRNAIVKASKVTAEQYRTMKQNAFALAQDSYSSATVNREFIELFEQLSKKME